MEKKNKRTLSLLKDSDIAKANLDIEVDNNHYRIAIHAKIDANSDTGDHKLTVINSLALVMSSDDDKRLFSRICFDPINIAVDTELSLTYYVYF